MEIELIMYLEVTIQVNGKKSLHTKALQIIFYLQYFLNIKIFMFIMEKGAPIIVILIQNLLIIQNINQDWVLEEMKDILNIEYG